MSEDGASGEHAPPRTNTQQADPPESERATIERELQRQKEKLTRKPATPSQGGER